MSHPEDLSPATIAVTAGRPEPTPGAPVNPPVVLTSTFSADGPTNYARVDQPTWTPFEETVGALEGGAALVFSSGMAATAAVLSLLAPGAIVVAPASAYNGVVVTLTERAERGDLSVRWVDVTDTEAVLSACPGADLLWLESPTNPLLDVADLPALIRGAHEAGVIVAVDNTFATPLLQQPLADGADLVVHSATKYLSGHSDVILGVVVTAPGEDGGVLHERLARHRTLHGAIAGPVETWLALRGIRTLAVRLERACASAAIIARRCEEHRAVRRTRYPGFSAMVSIEVGSIERAERLAAATRLWSHSTSLGGVESQLERRRRQPGEPASTPEDLVRLSVGIEDVEDLWADLSAALDSLPS